MCVGEDASEDGDDCEDEPHECHGPEEERSSTDARGQECEGDGAEEGEHRGGSCYEGLVECGGYSNVIEHSVEIITYNPISRPLFTNPKPNHDEYPPFIPLCTPHLTPSRLLRCNFEFDCAYDLAKFKLNDFIFTVAVCVIMGEDVEGGFFAPFAD